MGPFSRFISVYLFISAYLLVSLFTHASSWAVPPSDSAPSKSSAAPPTSPSVLKGDCATEVRLDGPGGTMENVPVRDQGNLSICFAEAAAEQLSAIQSKLHVKKPVNLSGMAIAAGLSAQSGCNAFTHGGDPCEAVSYAVKNGVCSVDDIENRNPDSDGRLGQNINQVAGHAAKHEFDKLGKKYDGCENRKYNTVHVMNDKDLIHTLLKESSDITTAYKDLMKNCSQSPHQLKAENPLNPIKLSCKRFPGEKEAGRHISPHEYQEKLEHLLDGESPVPTTIGFCSRILTDITKKDAPPASKDSCGGHAAVVIGKRPMNGKCQFLLRNSWGTECDHYSPDIQSQCERGKGNVWVDAETLTKNTLEIIPSPL